MVNNSSEVEMRAKTLGSRTAAVDDAGCKAGISVLGIVNHSTTRTETRYIYMFHAIQAIQAMQYEGSCSNLWGYGKSPLV